jgi:hypothetical protein
MKNIDLLRKYEPIACYTEGEAFFPIAVDEYVKECSLWLVDAQGKDQMLIPRGQLEIDHLAGFEEIPENRTLYLRFVDQPLDPIEYQRWLRDPTRVRFKAPGRLARVPLVFRLVDSFFDLSLFVRGRVPGDKAAAADIINRTIEKRDSRRVYYGRVFRSGGWIALQYLFFFSMNNWRSGFSGVNDHEADWEQVIVFLSESGNEEPEPHWIAYASHDYKGDDLRRRWDDPMLAREGKHPLIFVGAGSHASYFEPGEYLMGAEPEFIKPFKAGAIWLRKFWNETLGMGFSAGPQQSNKAVLNVPFIDYARGDGLRIGPDHDESWSPEIISDDVGWVNKYRGLWGLDTHDPLGGERAPAGPKYNRDGSVRQSWYDPVGWAGLDKVYPPNELIGVAQERLAAAQKEIKDLSHEIENEREILRRQALDVDALKSSEYFAALLAKKKEQLKNSEKAFQELQHRKTELLEINRGLDTYTKRLQRGETVSPEAHLHRIHRPEPPLPPQYRAVEVWAAISGALILLGIFLVLILQPKQWYVWLIGFGVVMGAVENLVRRNLVNYLLNIIIILACISAIILLIEFWQLFLGLLLIGLVIFIIRGNLQEIYR